MNIIQELEAEEAARVLGDRKIPEFQPGDTVRVNVKIKEKFPDRKVKLVAVHTPSYSGSQVSGYNAAVTSLVKAFATQGKPTEKINIFTGWVNITGLPAISLPVGLSLSGLPIGAQFVAGFGADAALLDFALAIEKDVPPPPLPALED